MANRNFASGGKIYSMHVMPVLVDCNFQVAAADSAGNGIINLKGPMVQNVLMHTSATPSASNPNPALGTIVIRLADNYNKLFSFRASMISPSSGSDVKIDNSAMTAGVAYTITTLGNATAAKWHLIGVPAGITPAVGVSFIAASNGGAGNVLTSRVQATAASGSGIDHIEMVPSSNGDIAPDGLANQGYGAQFILQCYAAGVKTQPADGSVIAIEMYLSNSSVIIQGE